MPTHFGSVLVVMGKARKFYPARCGISRIDRDRLSQVDQSDYDRATGGFALFAEVT